jgi:RHS repeat-associated protein
VLPGEVALEAHQFNGAAQAKRSTTPAEDFGYEYNSFLALTSQYDLLHPQIASGSKVSCTTSSNCAVGYGCWRNVAAVGGDNFCYRVDTIQWNTTTFATSIINGSSAKAGSGCVLHPAAQMFKTKVTTAPSGMKTSYSWDTKGRPLCIVEGDNDDVAGTPPSCSGPATARVTSFSYTGDLSTCDLTITETRKSIVSGASPNQTSTTTAYDCVGNVTSRSVTGWTRSLAGTAVQETRAATSTFDNLGRLTRTDGPMPNTTAFDVVDYAYHGATGDANAYRLQSVTRYAGTSSTCPGGAGCVALTTTYENYDKFGTPRTVMDPSGIQTVRVTDALGRVTEERVYSSLGDEVRSLTYNPYGSVRSQIDGDGVCSTFDYNTNGTLRARRRSAVGSLCGATPISLSVGEVEAYVYDVAYPTQVAEVDRYQDGTLRYQKKLTYDGKGYLGSRASSIDPTKARTYTYDPIGLMTADQDANCYPGSTTCTKSTFGVDPLGRRTSEARAVTDTQNAVTGFQYASSDAILPSSVTTGDGTTVATTTTYVYNDFAELVEFVSPDSGTTRLAYDPGGHAITRREGVGTADQRTVQTTFDSLGRPTLVDHDTEHPVDCASAPTGTPITDEEYVYDTCPGTVPTGFTCGSQAAGRLTLARVKLHCSGGTEFGRGTWYQYGPSGRVAAVAVADDSQMATPFVTTYEWTPGGRTRTITNPLSASYGMKFAYGPDGEVLEVRQTDATETPYVTGVSHAPFGPVTGYTTQSMSGGQPMVIEVGYYPDYSVQTKEAKRGGTVLGGFTYTRDETGRVTARNSLFTGADAPIDRWYLYDRVGRLLCETTSPQSTCPTSGPDLRATFTYNNGQAGLAPDNRASAAFATDGVTFPLGAAGAYTYAPSSNRLTSVGTLNYYYDALGRRTKDDDTYFSGIYDEARTYTYLPNGRLGTIQGKVPADGATGVQYDDYTVAIAYDHRGRMFHWSYTRTGIYAGTDSYDVFYDERDRLIAVNWNPNTNRSASEVPRTWHVAYLHGERISTTQVQDLATLRGWYLNDELGVSYQEFDAVGTAVSRDIEGFGSASPASQGILDFRLPGQLALPGTEVVSFDPGSSCNGADCPVVATRALVLHNWNRDYDSDIGRYMEDDPARSPLTQAREYTYSGNAPLLETDPTGLAPKIDCVDPIRRQLLETAIYLALATIAHCKSGCAFGSNFLEPEWFSYRTRWMENILESHYQCKDLNMNCGEFIPRVESGEDRLLNIGTRGFFHPARCGCLEGLVAHEALHEAPFGYAHWKFLPPIEWKNIHAVDPGYVIPEKCFPCAVGAN